MEERLRCSSFPNRVKKTVTWGAPVWDPLGTQKAEVGQENVDRKSNKGDLVSIFDNSAKKTTHPNPFSYAPSFWHDFHKTRQAERLEVMSLGVSRSRPKGQ